MSKITPPKNEDVITKGYDPKIANRLFAYMKPYWVQFAVATVMVIIQSMYYILGPVAVKIALDEGIGGGSRVILRNAVLGYIGLTGMMWLMLYLRITMMAKVGQSIIFDLRDDLFVHLQRLSLTFFNRYSVGRVISRVINDVVVVRQFVTFAIIASMRDLFVLAGILVAMLSMNLKLSLITFTVMPVMAVVTFLFRKYARETYRDVRAAVSWVNSVLAENINAIRVVQAFSREDHNYGFFSQTVNQHNLDVNLKAARISAGFFPSMDLFGSIATGLVVWMGGVAVINQEITAGVLVAFVLYVSRFFDPIRSLSQRYDQMQSTMAGGERIFALIDTPAEVEDAPDAVELPPIVGNVDFRNVSFRYPDDEETPVLEDVNLSVKAGETIALVGETGAGKSTVIKLLSRFHDPTEGSLLVDGYDLRQVKQQSLRAQMGIVLQDPFLFGGTVQDNIKFGNMNASDEEIVAAAKAVGAHDFIMQMDDGYLSSVEEGGVVLSVGQRQLISFARALLADPRILILDEATSSVDTQTEQVIQRALAQLLQGRTAFVIAHRLSTITNADRILVIEDGRIIEDGTHSELIALEGYYSHLYKMGFAE